VSAKFWRIFDMGISFYKMDENIADANHGNPDHSTTLKLF
jgi:hypothetical protein